MGDNTPTTRNINDFLTPNLWGAAPFERISPYKRRYIMSHEGIEDAIFGVRKWNDGKYYFERDGILYAELERMEIGIRFQEV